MLALALIATLASGDPSRATAPDTVHYEVLNHGRVAGELDVVRDGDRVTVRYRYVDRNRGSGVEKHYRLAPTGEVLAAELRPLPFNGGPAGEPTLRYEVRGDSAHWTMSASGRGGRAGGRGGQGPSAVKLAPGMFFGASGTPWDDALLAKNLLTRPDRSARLLPGGSARAEVVADTVVPTSRGPQRVRLVMLYGGSTTPNGVWIDANGELFASDVAWFITVKPGDVAAMPMLRDIEIRWRDAQAAALAKRLTTPAAGAVVIRDADVFDSERGVVMPRTTVVIRGDRIAAVGPTASTTVPDGATVIDGTGKTVVPGLWDMHTHFQLASETSGTIAQLATGITTIRDLAADTDYSTSIRDRLATGEILGPRAILAGFIEGPGAWAGPTDVLARTEDEASRFVAMYDSLGYRQIKLYNLVHPDLVPVIARDAHARGMRLSGHIPRGMSVQAAVNLGYDEINHAAFLFSTFFQDSLYWPTMRAYSAVASAVSPTFDVDGPEMTDLIDFLRQHQTVIDGTFNIWMGAGTLNGQGNPGSAAYGRLLKRLYDAGVPLVAGTDNNSGATYILELELYQHAGIPAPAVLQIATINSARVMHDERDYGSISAGKVADLIVVNGRPAERVSDLRNLDRVVRAGRVYDPKALRAALVGVP